MKKVVIALATVISTIASSAYAQVYVGGAIGQGHVNADCSGVPDCSKNSTGYKFFGGYKLTPNIAGEVTYFDFGKASAPGAEVRGTGVGVGAAFTAEFAPQFTGVARAGIASNRIRVEAASFDQSESNIKPYIGFGVGYEVGYGLQVTGAVDFSRGKFQGDSASLRLISLGAHYAF